MAASDLSMCIYHLDRRGMCHDGWKDNNPETCVRCVTGKYPDWELPADFKSDTNYNDAALDDHVRRMLGEYYAAPGTAR